METITLPASVRPTTSTRTSDADTREIESLRAHLLTMAVVSDLVARLESAEDLPAAGRLATDLLRQHLGCEQVVLGHCDPGSLACKVLAISDTTTFHKQNERVVAAQMVLQEAIAQSRISTYPPAREEKGSGSGLLAHRQFIEHSGQVILSGPLRDSRGDLMGAWLVVENDAAQSPHRTTSFFRAAEVPVASALALVRRAAPGRLARSWRSLCSFATSRKGLVATAVCLLGALALLIPVPYHARCQCTVEPAERRFVAAPFDATLDEVLTEPGALVAVGQTLARIDGREIRWELAGVEAELHRVRKEHRGYVASHQLGQAELSRHDIERLQLRLQLLQKRIENLQIDSPMEGVVVSGDVRDAEGMPLQVGQTLFEIAPLDEMVVELGIAQDDFAYVRTGMPVTIRLEAFPLEPIRATVQRIRPRSELRDEENVFIAEVELENLDGRLRPGMRGHARIEADRYPLAWNWLRRPVAAGIAWMGW